MTEAGTESRITCHSLPATVFRLSSSVIIYLRRLT
jgi:hypothetical protein